MRMTSWMRRQAHKDDREIVILDYIEGKWTELPTTVHTEDGDAVEACGTTTSFSPFVLAVKVLEESEETVQPTVVPAPTPPPDPSPIPPETGGGSPSPSGILLLLLIGAAATALALLMRPKRQNR